MMLIDYDTYHGVTMLKLTLFDDESMPQGLMFVMSANTLMLVSFTMINLTV